MTDTAILAVVVKSTLLDISKQAFGLGTGLQNVAPGEKLGSPNNSVQYLLKIAEGISNFAKECDQLESPSPNISQD